MMIVDVMNSGSQLSEMYTISRKFTRHVMSLSWSMYLYLSLSLSSSESFFLLVRSCLLITLVLCLKGHKSLGQLFESVL